MWKLFPILLLLLGTPRLPAQSAVQPAEEQARILGLENAWDRAVKEKDVAALKMLLAPELVYGPSPADRERIHECTSLRGSCRGQRCVPRDWREEWKAIHAPRAFYGHVGAPKRELDVCGQPFHVDQPVRAVLLIPLLSGR